MQVNPQQAETENSYFHCVLLRTFHIYILYICLFFQVIMKAMGFLPGLS